MFVPTVPWVHIITCAHAVPCVPTVPWVHIKPCVHAVPCVHAYGHSHNVSASLNWAGCLAQAVCLAAFLFLKHSKLIFRKKCLLSNLLNLDKKMVEGKMTFVLSSNTSFIVQVKAFHDLSDLIYMPSFHFITHDSIHPVQWVPSSSDTALLL